MGRFLLVAGLGSVVAVPCFAQETEPESSVKEIRALIDEKVTYEQVSTDLQDAIAAYTDARNAGRSSQLIAVTLLLSLVFKLLLSGLKMTNLLKLWPERRGTLIRLTTLGLAALVYLTGSIAGGMPWWEALFLSLSGPGAIVLHEYSALLGLKRR